MDPLRIHAYKVHAIKKHKRQQFVGTVLLYSLTTLACTLFCSSPLWYPPFCATFNVIFFLALPKICSFFFTSKVLFIVGNLIVIFLVGESKFFASKSKALHADYSDIFYDKYKSNISEPRAKKERGVATCSLELHEDLELEDLGLGEEASLPAEELNKLADDFIARVNRQRKLEAEFPRR
ncbi:hypothetical protein L1987_66878 [Smallanthus sonchifolius]|uniref:Uncharacterized protein n=1 Tax=Smallanthus sonchifolius TaxID=185202 RepID=A0ACB9BYD3_9ASTR|nr:hypothetical protein L1987_66878 [Smallanthus sonchifolius]